MFKPIKNVRKKRTFLMIFLWARNTQIFRFGLYRLSIRILERRPLYSVHTNFDRSGLLRQRIKHTKLFMDENAASTIFQKVFFKVEA
mgnify:CR=1 FL=1